MGKGSPCRRPFFAGVTIFFVDPPELDMDFTGAADFVDLPVIRSVVRCMELLEKDGNGWNMTMWGWELGGWKITAYPCLSFLVGSLRNMQHMIPNELFLR